MNYKFKARHIAIGFKEDGWAFFDVLGRIYRIEYDNGEVCEEFDYVETVSIHDINVKTIQLIGMEEF